MGEGYMSDRESDTTLSALLNEVRELRAQVESCRSALSAAPRVTLRALQDNRFLGQTVNLVAAVTDRSLDRPVADAPLTFVATWGRLWADYSIETEQGSTVTVRTDVDGRAWITLLPPAAQDLSAIQQDSLEVALKLLDPDARTPADTAAGLAEFVDLYNREGNIELRKAVDGYFRDSGHRPLEESGLLREMGAWQYLDATVLVLVGTDGDDRSGHPLNSAVLGIANLPLRVKDWLGPWLQTYRGLAQAGSSLSEELKRVAARGGDASTILGKIQREVGDFIIDQRGMIGESVGREAVQVALRDFLAADHQGLSPQTRTALFPALEIASQTVAAGGHSALAAIGHASTSLSREIDTKVASISAPDLSGITAQIDDLRRSVGGKLDASQFDRFRTEVNGRFDSKVDGAALTDYQHRIDTRLDAKADHSRLTDLQDQVNTALAGKADGTALTDYQRRIDARLDAKADHSRLTDLQDQVNTALAGKADGTALEGLRTEIRESLAEKADASAVNKLRADTDSSLAAKADRTSLQALADSAKEELTALQDTSLQLRQTVSGLNTSLGRIDKDVVDLKKNTRRGPGG